MYVVVLRTFKGAGQQETYSFFDSDKAVTVDNDLIEIRKREVQAKREVDAKKYTFEVVDGICENHGSWDNRKNYQGWNLMEIK